MLRKRAADGGSGRLGIQAAGLTVVGFAANRPGNLVRYTFDVPGALPGDGGRHSAAAGVPQHHHQRAVQMSCRVFDAAKDALVDHVPGYPDGEQLPDPAGEDRLRDLPGVRAGHDDREGMLPVFRRIAADPAGNIANLVGGFQVFTVA